MVFIDLTFGWTTVLWVCLGGFVCLCLLVLFLCELVFKSVWNLCILLLVVLVFTFVIANFLIRVPVVLCFTLDLVFLELKLHCIMR